MLTGPSCTFRQQHLLDRCIVLLTRRSSPILRRVDVTCARSTSFSEGRHAQVLPLPCRTPFPATQAHRSRAASGEARPQHVAPGRLASSVSFSFSLATSSLRARSHARCMLLRALRWRPHASWIRPHHGLIFLQDAIFSISLAFA